MAVDAPADVIVIDSGKANVVVAVEPPVPQDQIVVDVEETSLAHICPLLELHAKPLYEKVNQSVHVAGPLDHQGENGDVSRWTTSHRGLTQRWRVLKGKLLQIRYCFLRTIGRALHGTSRLIARGTIEARRIISQPLKRWSSSARSY